MNDTTIRHRRRMTPRRTQLHTCPAEIWLDEFGHWWCGNDELDLDAERALRAFGGDNPALDLIDLLTTPFEELDDEVIARILSRGPVAEVLEILSRHPARWVRQEVAENEFTPSRVLDELSQGADVVRAAVAMNECADADTLARLASDRDNDVRFLAGINCGTPRRVLLELAAAEDETSRCAAATNPRTHRAALRWLSTEPGEVGDCARESLARLVADEPEAR